MGRKSMPWLLVALTSGAGLFWFLYSTAEPAQLPGVVLVSASPTPAPNAVPLEQPLPVLVKVVVDGAASRARFHLGDGVEHSIGIGQSPQPGWALRAVDSGSATFATPGGLRRIRLSAPLVVEAKPVAKTVLVPDAPATSADGEAVARCTDPEC